MTCLVSGERGEAEAGFEPRESGRRACNLTIRPKGQGHSQGQEALRAKEGTWDGAWPGWGMSCSAWHGEGTDCGLWVKGH